VGRGGALRIHEDTGDFRVICVATRPSACTCSAAFGRKAGRPVAETSNWRSTGSRPFHDPENRDDDEKA
jgi:hypothetical protein